MSRSQNTSEVAVVMNVRVLTWPPALAPNSPQGLCLRLHQVASRGSQNPNINPSRQGVFLLTQKHAFTCCLDHKPH